MDLTKVILKNAIAWEELTSERFHRVIGLLIEGIEVTQAIQYYDAQEHLTDAANRGPDNSIRLVSGKPAWVPVYLGSFFGA